MTLQQLKQYRPIKTEIAELQRRLKRECTVSDVVSGSYSESPYTLHTLEIEGIENSQTANAYQHQIVKLTTELQEIKRYIEDIDDYLVRLALRLKCCDGLKWSQIAQRIGGGNTADSIKKQAYRYLSSHN